MKMHPVGAELFHAGTDRHDKANSHFSHSANTQKRSGCFIKSHGNEWRFYYYYYYYYFSIIKIHN